MSKSVIINGVTYADVPYVNIPLSAGGGNAKFVDTDSGDAVAGDIRSGKKAWVDGNEITGTAPVKSASDVTVSGNTVTTPAGIYDSSVSKSVADASVSARVGTTTNLRSTTTSNYYYKSTPSARVNTAGYIGEDVNGYESVTYFATEEKTCTPSTSAQEITNTAGTIMTKVTVAAVAVGGDAQPSDVLSGKTFLSAGSLSVKTGTATVPVVAQDSTTKVLTVS